MKLQTTSTFGNFKWTAEAEVTEAQAEILANAGLLQVLQRSPATAAEKSLAGYEKRPDKFERKSIEYTDSNARQLEKFLSAEIEIADGVKITPTVVAQFHEIGASAAPKFVEEKAIIARHVKTGDLAEWASETIAYSGETVDHDGNASNEFLAAVKAYKTKMLASV